MTRFVHSMRGLGDNIYQRAFVRSLTGKVVIDTPWPQLYEDLPNVTCVRPRDSVLRTQTKNVNAYKWRSSVATPGNGVGGIRPSYREEGIFAGMRKAFGIDPQALDLPATMREPLDGLKPGTYVVVRPVTVRSEWRADSRNPDPHYVFEAVTLAYQAGYTVISVADLQEGAEWAVGALPPAHHRYHEGQLNVVQLMRLVANAALVIGGVGWLLPAALATGVPAWIICGGQGGYNHPNLITKGFTGGVHVRFVMPDNFCMCKEKTHNCNKRITDHDKKFRAYLE